MVNKKLILGLVAAASAAVVVYGVATSRRQPAPRPSSGGPVYRQVTNNGQPTGINAMPSDLQNWDAWI